jgi:hypothetical protein
LKLDPRRANTFYTALQAAGMPDVPGEFSVVPEHQVIPAAILAEISDFIRAFDRVTGRMTWQAAALREAPVIARLRRPEVCFFSAWDFHLPPEGGCRLIEFNDNGSGFLFAAIINALYHEVVGLGQERQIATPAGLPAFEHHIADLIEREAKAFFGEGRADLFFVLDDADSLQQGKFRRELELLVELLRRRGAGRARMPRGASLGRPAGAVPAGGGGLHREPLDRFLLAGPMFCRLAQRLSGGLRLMRRPIPSPMRRAAISGFWNGCHCRIGTRTSESSPRNVES